VRRGKPVRRAITAALACALGAGSLALAATPAPPLPHHELEIRLDPAARTLAVHDRLTLASGGEIDFLLNAALTITAAEPPATELPPPDDLTPFAGINAAPDAPSGARLKRWRVQLPPAGGTVELRYEGPFDFGLGELAEEYQRGFRETTGIVSPEGVYLAGNGFWYPQTGRGLLTFTLTAEVPAGWHLVSQGSGTSRDEAGRARWEAGGPMDEIYLVGGPLTRYHQPAGEIAAEVYLRAPDEALAGRYLAATADYLEMYRRLIGPYPYGKFALVENFWETGYGMPSFTLLGPQVIRLPFILTSSYPHEILHNWWGNSVFVDYESGNWCEGLTAYLADHLIQEQRGQGAAYRRDVLQRYRNYVREAHDFPLTEFRARHSAATEAVGYGRSLMGFHMLRRMLGDDAFRAWAVRLYQEERGRQASFANLRRHFEAIAQRDLGPFFHDWIERTGATELAVEIAAVEPRDGKYELRGRLLQKQAGEPFRLAVPIAIQTAGATVETTLSMTAAELPFTLRLPAAPLALHLDPAFDLFRRLDPREIPPSIGQLFGAPEVLAVLPAGAAPEEAAAWRALVDSWQAPAHTLTLTTDAEITELPADRAVWLLGRENRFAARLYGDRAGVMIGKDELALQGETIPFAGHAAVAVVRHPADPEAAVGWIVADSTEMLAGLGRKLPHYGKYSFLGFRGAELTNTVKGQWETTDSPLVVDLRPAAKRDEPLPPLALPPRPPLAELPR
jgi:hypothetical protein